MTVAQIVSVPVSKLTMTVIRKGKIHVQIQIPVLHVNKNSDKVLF